MADLILVQPVVGNMDSIRSAPSLPLALLEAASLVDARGYRVKLIDQRLDRRWREHLISELKAGPLCVGTTAMTGPQIGGALEASRVVKENSDIPMVWGGIHASLLPEQTLRDPRVDFVVKGEGEETLLELVRTLGNGKEFDGVRGLWWKDPGGGIHANPERPFLDMDALPDPPFHLVNPRDYMPLYMGMRTIYLQSSRGCPYPCAYCYNTAFNDRKWRMLSAERTVALIRKVRDLGAENIWFVDDEVIIQRRRLEDICKSILAESLDIHWEVQGIRVNNALRMDDAMLRLVERSGCVRLIFGVESASEKILRMVKRNIPLEQVRAVNRRLRETGIIAHFNFMCGFPEETPEDLRQTVEFVLSLLRENPRARIAGIHIFTPYPGTELYDYVVRKGYFTPPQTLEGWADFGWMTTPMATQDKESLESLFFCSLFADRKWNENLTNPLARAAAAAYGPVARWRMKNLFFKFMFEKRLARALYPPHMPNHPRAASEPFERRAPPAPAEPCG
ncbi:MAG: radical SAM protein [Halobacteria archaeon]